MSRGRIGSLAAALFAVAMLIGGPPAAARAGSHCRLRAEAKGCKLNVFVYASDRKRNLVSYNPHTRTLFEVSISSPACRVPPSSGYGNFDVPAVAFISRRAVIGSDYLIRSAPADDNNNSTVNGQLRLLSASRARLDATFAVHTIFSGGYTVNCSGSVHTTLKRVQ